MVSLSGVAYGFSKVIYNIFGHSIRMMGHPLPLILSISALDMMTEVGSDWM
jgi:hypothetical protein